MSVAGQGQEQGAGEERRRMAHVLLGGQGGRGHTHYCRLCLAVTDGHTRLLDPIIMDFLQHRPSRRLADVLYDISGVTFLSEPMLPNAVCKTCVTSALNCLAFKTICQESMTNWTKSVDSLKNLAQFTHVTEKTRSLYVVINENSTKLIEDYKKRSKRKKVCKRARFLILKKRNKCEFCSGHFGKKRSLDEHLRKFHFDKDPFRCVHCGKVFKSRQFLNRHYRDHLEIEQRYSCNKCNNKFTDRWHMKRHIEAVHGEKNVKCPYCPKYFGSNSILKIHKQKVHCDYKFECSRCPKTFKTKSRVTEHEQSHVDKICDKCGKIYKSKANYVMHTEKCNNSETAKATIKSTNNQMKHLQHYMCDLCGKVFIQKRGLVHHIDTIHLKKKSHACFVCGKKFSTTGQVKVHQIVHTKERPERCLICEKNFVTKAALLYHIRLHTGERPYVCEICGEAFVNASRRMAHKRMRHLDRSHECKVCGQKFYTSYCLRTHMARHYNPSSKLFCDKKPEYVNKSLKV